MSKPPALEVGSLVHVGEEGTEGHDTGRVIELDGERAFVSWYRTQITIWQEASSLRPISPAWQAYFAPAQTGPLLSEIDWFE